MMMKIKWVIARFIERLGFAGYLVVAAAIGLCLVYSLVLLPTKQQLLSIPSSHQSPIQPIQQLTPEEELNQFVTQFPKSNQRVNNIQTIINTASEMGLGLDNIAYKTSHTKEELLSHYHIDFILVGRYQDVRQYLATVMTKMPFASLDALHMDRQSVEQDFIRTRVRLTLHFS